MRPLAALLSLLLLSALLPSITATAADPCGRPPLRACAPGEAPSDGGAPNGPPAKSGFTSKYPSDRSVALFQDSQPPKGSFTDKNYPYYGVTFDSSTRNQSIPFMKVENRRSDGNRDEYLCTSIDDPECSAEKNWQAIFVEGGIGNCAVNPGTACVASFSVITAEGKEVIAKPLMKFPKNAKEFPGKVNPAGHFGFVPDSFLTNLPLVQVTVIFFADAAAGLAATTSLISLTSGAGTSFLTSGAGGSFLTSAVPVLCVAAEDVWFNLMRRVGDEKVKFSALKKTHLPI